MQAPKLTPDQLATAKSLYEDGESIASISRQFGVSTAAIRKRARKHGWRRPTGTWHEAVKETSTAQMLSDPPTAHERAVVAQGRRSLLKAEKIVDAFSTGASEATVCRLAGIDPKTLHAWWDDDPEFHRLSHAARADFSIRKMQEIDGAGAADWRAASYMAERHDATGEQFGQNIRGGGGIGGITVTINVPVPQIVEVGHSPIIDITPVEDVTKE